MLGQKDQRNKGDGALPTLDITTQQQDRKSHNAESCSHVTGPGRPKILAKMDIMPFLHFPYFRCNIRCREVRYTDILHDEDGGQY